MPQAFFPSHKLNKKNKERSIILRVVSKPIHKQFFLPRQDHILQGKAHCWFPISAVSPKAPDGGLELDSALQPASQGYTRRLCMSGNKAQISWLPACVKIVFCVAGTAATAPGLDLWARTVRPSFPCVGHNHATTTPLVRTMMTLTHATVGQVSSKVSYKYSLSASRVFFCFLFFW